MAAQTEDSAVRRSRTWMPLATVLCAVSAGSDQLNAPKPFRARRLSIAVRTSRTCTALITVPPGAIAPFGPEPSVKLSENVAVTDWLTFIVRAQAVPVPLHAPPHCLNVAPLPAEAVSVTEVPEL